MRFWTKAVLVLEIPFMVPTITKILPVRVDLIDQLLLPRTAPAFDPLLHGNGFNYKRIPFKPDQLMAEELIRE